MNTKERIEFAEQRIKELQLLIQHWRKNDASNNDSKHRNTSQ